RARAETKHGPTPIGLEQGRVSEERFRVWCVLCFLLRRPYFLLLLHPPPSTFYTPQINDITLESRGRGSVGYDIRIHSRLSPCTPSEMVKQGLFCDLLSGADSDPTPLATAVHRHPS